MAAPLGEALIAAHICNIAVFEPCSDLGSAPGMSADCGEPDQSSVVRMVVDLDCSDVSFVAHSEHLVLLAGFSDSSVATVLRQMALLVGNMAASWTLRIWHAADSR